MKLKIYIVTYNNIYDLNRNINSLYKSDLGDHNIEVNVINNHSTFSLKALDNIDRIKVLHNTLRPDFSTGHLSRNWNQAIINGFKDLKNPDCDILVHCQDDMIWSHSWLNHLIDIHKTYTFFSGQVGDTFCSYTSEAVRHVGLWDERFCNIGLQEFDYFLRALLHNRDKSSINSYVYTPKTGKRIKDLLLNPIDNIDEKFPRRYDRNSKREFEHQRSAKYHKHSKLLFKSKWGIDHPRPVFEGKVSVGESLIKNFIYYPYFEKDVYDLAKKNYLVNL